MRKNISHEAPTHLWKGVYYVPCIFVGMIFGSYLSHLSGTHIIPGIGFGAVYGILGGILLDHHQK